jgi:hypothetical protein
MGTISISQVKFLKVESSQRFGFRNTMEISHPKLSGFKNLIQCILGKRIHILVQA